MTASSLASVLERQLLMQLGERLKRLRESQGIRAVDMAARVGVTRNTLRAIESGDPSPSIGTWLRVMSELGVGGELALVASDAMRPAPSRPAAGRSRRPAPVVQVLVSADDSPHGVQDLQSLALHEAAIELARTDPAIVERAHQTLSRWLSTGDARSAPLWQEWQHILTTGAWRKVLGRTRHAQQLRQASPLVTALPDDVRADILEQVRRIRHGIVLGASPDTPSGGPGHRKTA